MAFVLSVVLSVVTYQLARWYLLDRREALALRQVTFDALVVKGQLAADNTTPTDALTALQSTNNARAVLHLDGTWYAVVVQFGESAVPTSLRRVVRSDGAGSQRAFVDGAPYLVYGLRLPGRDAEYYEFVSAEEYERTINVLGTVLLFAATATTLGGALAGWRISRRLTKPLATVAESARTISDGDLSHRLVVRDDPDLRTVATSFNEMAASLEARIERERRFTADVSHELRTPLTALGAAVSLAKRSELSERGRYAMDMLDQQLQHFTRLTVELLEISRMDSGVATLEPGDVDVVELIERVLDHAHVELRTLHVNEPFERVRRLDGTRFERVIANLVENADRYAGGVTRIELTDSNGDLVLTIDDSGPGVPPEEREAIFGRFNRGSVSQPADKPKGTGLGLALVHEHINMHHGSVFVADSPCGGARFVVRIPAKVTA
jgi:signal transduction histidine kinase